MRMEPALPSVTAAGLVRPAEARPKDVPRWNFHKYLVGRDGYIAEAFPETIEPSDTRVKTAIGRALAET